MATIPRAGSTVLPPLQRNRTWPQSPEQVLQFCPLFRETGHGHSPQSMFYSSAPSAEKPDMTTIPRPCSTVLPPLQRNKNAAVAPWSNAERTAAAQQPEALEDHSLHPNPWSNAARTAVGQHGEPSEDHSLHPNHWTDHLRRNDKVTGTHSHKLVVN